MDHLLQLRLFPALLESLSQLVKAGNSVFSGAESALLALVVLALGDVGLESEFLDAPFELNIVRGLVSLGHPLDHSFLVEVDALVARLLLVLRVGFVVGRGVEGVAVRDGPRRVVVGLVLRYLRLERALRYLPIFLLLKHRLPPLLLLLQLFRAQQNLYYFLVLVHRQTFLFFFSLNESSSLSLSQLH